MTAQGSGMRVWMWTVAPGSDPVAEEDVLAGWVDDATRVRAAQRMPEGRWALLAAHAVCRLQLSAAFGLPPQDWRFTMTPHGRPVLAEPRPGMPADGFSLSHAADRAGCALLLDAAAADAAVGFDLEVPRAGRPAVALARRFLHPDEAAWIAAADDPVFAFTRLWTFKESLTKALGRGIQEDFKGFATQATPPHLVSAPPAFGPLRRWSLTAGEVGNALWALAVRGDGAPQVVVRHLRVEDLSTLATGGARG